MPVQYLTVEEHAGQRLDNFLLRELKTVPRARIYRMIRRGEVRVNGQRAQVTRRLLAGDRVRVPPYSTVATRSSPELPKWLEGVASDSVIFEDASLIVIDKPSGVAVHGGSNVAHGLVDAVRKVRDSESIHLVHRIDRDTSGCVLFAKSREVLLRLHSAFREGEIAKTYTAIVQGQVSDDERIIDEPLLRYRLPNGERRVRVDSNGQNSSTTIRVIDRCPRASRVEALPATGRTHQIRVHLAYIGHTILGDEKYHDRQNTIKAPRLMLHANYIAVPGLFSAHCDAPSVFHEVWSSLSEIRK